MPTPSSPDNAALADTIEAALRDAHDQDVSLRRYAEAAARAVEPLIRAAEAAALERAVAPLTEEEARSAALSFRHDFGLLSVTDQAAMVWAAREWHKALSWRLRALPRDGSSLDAVVAARTAAVLDAEPYLVWSNEHRAWWRANGCGYTIHVEAAGLYSRADALKICHKGRGGWRRSGVPDEVPVRLSDLPDIARAAITTLDPAP